MADGPLNAALNLMRRMPPSQVSNSLAGLVQIRPDLADSLFVNVDEALTLESDTVTGKQFITCDYNRDGDSYRSPFSNKYFPPCEDGFLPSTRHREMEKMANQLFETYRGLYFKEGYCAVYVFDIEEGESESQKFGACWLVQKDVQGGNLQGGFWNSTHVFEVQPKDGKFEYNLTSNVMISMQLSDDKIGHIDLSGLRTKTSQEVAPAKDDAGHVCFMGKMLEDMELRIRNEIEGIYIQKTRSVTNGMRSATAKRDAQWGTMAAALNNAVFQLPKKG